MNNQKIALITGSNRGIGFETAKQLGQSGITVILTARHLDASKAAADKLTAIGINAHAVKLDVTKQEDREAAAAYIDSNFGKLDILINNAGVAPEESLFVSKTLDTTAEEFEYIYQTNFFGIVFLTKQMLPLLKKSDDGRIVNLSSILGSLAIHALKDSPIAGFRVLSYNSAKAALNMFTIQLASELESFGIKVNSAHPGWVQTELGGNDQAPMTVEDGAKTSVQLALLDENGPTGKFIHMGDEVAW